jgi:hypothetical protein
MRGALRLAVRFLLAATLTLLFAGCGGSKNEAPTAPAAPAEPAQQQMTPEDLRTVQAAAPFVHAIASQKYQEAYGLLSGYAKARMTLNQFVAPTDALTLERNEQSPFMNVTPANFAELMKKVEELYGLPQSVESLTVFSTDRDVLNRRSPEESGAIESASAIGAMPDSIPADVRRASVHGQIATQLTSEQLRQAALEMDMKPEDLQKDPNFKPSFNVKVVLLEEDGQLKVGYFEFLPASRWN